MVKKMTATPRAAAPRTVIADVAPRVSAHDIGRRAYELFQERGSGHGQDVEDWLRAEADLLEGNRSGVARPSAGVQRRLP
jgi:hypothetical protein